MNAFLLFSLLVSAYAAPAIVWKSRKSGKTLHSAESVTPEAIFTDLLSSEQPDDSRLSAVAFVLSRQKDGSESLSKYAQDGMLPEVASKYADASYIHHHVEGVLNANTFTRDATRVAADHNIVEISLSEFSEFNRFEQNSGQMEVGSNGEVSTTSKSAKKRARQLASAHVFVVSVEVNTKPEDIDSAVSAAIKNKSIRNVILSSTRSVDEVKQERELDQQRRMKLQEAAGRKMMQSKRRRLEDAGQENADGEDQNEDLEGVVYVSMTPNIFAGLLFFGLFTIVTYIGIGCMGMIQGQDVYVNKMPTIGREA